LPVGPHPQRTSADTNREQLPGDRSTGELQRIGEYARDDSAVAEHDSLV
jgi:hypothetical protein